MDDQRASDAPETDDDVVDEASVESFPASDAPGYRSASIGGRAADLRPPRHRLRNPDTEDRSA